MALWTWAFIAQTAENSVAAGSAAFAGSLVLTTTPTVKGLIGSAVAASVVALYTFTKALGGFQATKALVKEGKLSP
jgi:uncharacterized protein (DUF697 family)